VGGAGGANPLLDDAALFRLDVYGGDAHCDAGRLAAGAGAAIASHTYARGEAIQLDVPPGRRTVVLTSYADAAATRALGQACSDADVAPGSQICFDLTLLAAPDGGFVTPGGCVTAADCEATHSTGATCVDGSCRYGGCSTGWGDCSTAAPDTDGCETNLDSDVDHCGSCSRPCSSAHVAARHCTGGVCDSTCSGSFSNCSQPPAGAGSATADDGCEAPPHVNGIGATAVSWGLGQTYASCNPLGVPGDPRTYTVDMVTAARAASMLSGSDNTGSSCGAADCMHRAGADFCIVWCFSNDTSVTPTDLTAGHVRRNGSKQCYCPDDTDPTWN
jgi:hypothetical protein